MSSLQLILTLLIALLVSGVLAWPLFRDHSDDDTTENAKAETLQGLFHEKERLLRSLEELEGDYLTKKIQEADYHNEKHRLSLEIAERIQEIDLLNIPTRHAASRS